MNPGINALHFLISTIFELYIMLVAIRFLMQMTRADYYNPIAQFVVKATNPALIPLRRFVPGVAGHDVAAIVLCLLLLFIKLLLLKGLGLPEFIGSRVVPLPLVGAATLIWVSFVQLIELFFNIFIYGIVIQAILSWVSSGAQNPAFGILTNITAPILTPVRRLVPPMGGLDLSAIVALVGLQVLKILVIQNLVNISFG